MGRGWVSGVFPHVCPPLSLSSIWIPMCGPELELNVFNIKKLLYSEIMLFLIFGVRSSFFPIK